MMDVGYIVTYVCCALLVGLGGWMIFHTVDRRVHVGRDRLVSEELLAARLAGLEDRLAGRIAAVDVKLEDLEKWTQDIHRRLERLAER